MEDDNFELLKKIGIVLVIILIIATCGLLVYKNCNKKTIKNNSNTNTTENNKKDNTSISLENYAKIIKQSFENLDNMFLYDNTVKKIDFYANKKCDKVGAKVNLNSNGYTVNYTCNKEISKNVWEIKGKIDNSIDFNYTSNNNNINYYRINTFILKVEVGHSYNSINVTIYDSKNGNILGKLTDIIAPYTYDENDRKFNSNMYVKKGILYYHLASNIHVDEISNEDVSEDCSIYKIDFNKDYNSEKLHNYVCSYIRGN